MALALRSRSAAIVAFVLAAGVPSFAAAHSRTPTIHATAPLRANTGSFRYWERHLPSGTGPTMLVRGPDGNLWFSNIGNNTITRYQIAIEQLREYPLPRPNSDVLVMASGPDGNLWYSDGGYPVIGSITYNGRIAEYDLPSNIGAAGLAAGPDENIWLTGGPYDEIARFDIRHRSFTSFPLPHSGSAPCKITTGPDGALWFTELEGGRIGRLTLGGKLTEFPLPPKSRHSGPFMIIPGPDGALWFTEYFGGKIGRITTNGRLSEYATSSSGINPMHIVVGADKNLWFTEVGGNALGRITTGGTLTEFSFGNQSTSPDGIALGSDGGIWFTLYQADVLGTVLSPR